MPPRVSTQADRPGGGILAYLHVIWCTHGNDGVHICMESWDAIVVKYGAKVKISGNDTLQRIATSFTAYGVKRRRSALSQWYEFLFTYPLHCQIGEKHTRKPYQNAESRIPIIRMASLNFFSFSVRRLTVRKATIGAYAITK